jgi:lysophospholipase L1-like esterase
MLTFMRVAILLGTLIMQRILLCAQQPMPPLQVENAGKHGLDLQWHYDEPDGLRIVVLGSSTAAGMFVPKGCMFMLADSLAKAVPGSVVTNLAVGGYSSYKLLPTGMHSEVDPERNITRALSLHPQIIIVSLPSNDVLFGIPLATSMKNFRIIRAVAAAGHAKVFFTTTQPRNLPEASARELIRVTADSIRRQFNPFVIDVYDELTDVANKHFIKNKYINANQDGVHVNPSGHRYIFRTTLQAISPYLTNFEVFRSLSPDGPFEMVGKQISRVFRDSGLKPGTEYYYKVRTIHAQGHSDFSPVVKATTLAPETLQEGN